MKRVILVTYPDDFAIEEATGLVESAERSVLKVYTQKYLNHAQYGVGSGKADEITEFIRESGAEQIIIDEHMTSKQIYNLEKLSGVQVIDRERLILDIFYSRATTNEAKLQIQLAEIEYEMPRVREMAKLLSGDERPGKGGSGEYTVDVKFRDMKRRMGFIRAKLKDAESKRQLYQQQRERMGMPVVSLVGYTSAGKTTLFNLLTQEHKETSASLFTTLSTTTRSAKLDEQTSVLMTDTVGFISRLPTYMIDAFKSTLEESLHADLVLLLVDCSEKLDDIRIKYASCRNVLKELNADESKIQVVLSKQDRAENQSVEQIANILGLEDPVIVSSKSGFGLRKLKNTIRDRCKAGLQ